jgi:hypothetical protein
MRSEDAGESAVHWSPDDLAYLTLQEAHSPTGAATLG